MNESLLPHGSPMVPQDPPWNPHGATWAPHGPLMAPHGIFMAPHEAFIDSLRPPLGTPWPRMSPSMNYPCMSKNLAKPYKALGKSMFWALQELGQPRGLQWHPYCSIMVPHVPPMDPPWPRMRFPWTPHRPPWNPHGPTWGPHESLMACFAFLRAP